MEVTLLPLLESDLPFLIEVRNDESTRSQLGNDSLFTLEDSTQWFKKEQPEWLLIINHNLTRIGYMRIDGDTIGIDIHPNFRRKGYARLAYQKYLEDTDYADLWVFEDNHAKKLYEELGFVETGEYETLRDRKYLKMIYEK
jgi:ribosomal protein S18 acetylase RimI-like enzyme